MKPLLNLKPGDWIYCNGYIKQWLGKMMGTRGCRMATKKEIKKEKQKEE